PIAKVEVIGKMDSFIESMVFSTLKSGSFQGTQGAYYPKNKYGKEIIISGNPLLIPSVKHKFLFQDEDIVSLQQISGDGLKVYYEGKYQVIKNDYIILIECKLSNGDGSNPTMTIEYNKQYNQYTVKEDGIGGPEFYLYNKEYGKGDPEFDL
ncbi:hypothetical protein N9T93_01370, partial [Flavobacteriaceae bacterium]|nr:hypothetical protein [Flavobacteriaceae bacterium]